MAGAWGKRISLRMKNIDRNRLVSEQRTKVYFIYAKWANITEVTCRKRLYFNGHGHPEGLVQRESTVFMPGTYLCYVT